MANTSMSLDIWRKVFRNLNFDIFDIIENGIMVAASDFPNDFKLKRDRIVEMIFTCKFQLPLPINGDGVSENGGGDNDDNYKCGIESGESKNEKERKCSYEDAEALTDAIEEASQILKEFLRMKKILDNSEEESDATLLELLRKLQLMPMSVDTLKVSNIGKSVNSLRKHGSKDIRHLVKTLIGNWKTMVDDWVNATKDIVVEVEPESLKNIKVAPDEEEDEGLPSPPMDEGAFFAPPASMELSRFFDGMDEDGNPQKNRNYIVIKANLANVHNCKVDESLHAPKNRKMVQQKKNQEAPMCNPKSVTQPKPVNNEKRTVQHRAIKKNPIPSRQKLDSYDDVAMRIETSKRKLQERYEEVKNAKKQRTIQLVEFQDLPKKKVMQQQRNQRVNCINNFPAY